MCRSIRPSVGTSVGPSVRLSVRNPFFSNARKRVFLTCEIARVKGLQREVMGRDGGGREGNDEGRAKKDGASADMPRDASDGRVSGLM